jgi:hypothetical protein
VLLAGYLWLADLVHHRVDGAIVRNRRFLRTCLVLYGELILCERVDDDGTIDWRTSAFCGTKALTAIARSPQEMKMAADERG